MSKVDAITTHWAVLIGVDFCVDGHHLGGCVRDVELMEQYLEAWLTPITRVQKFTASAPLDPCSPRPAEEPDSWPTHENVTSSIAKITDEAKPGDFVCIHYSGHGTRARRFDIPNESIGDLKLVLFDKELKTRYLGGVMLSIMLKGMVEKGLFVTLVLDCCFSGSVRRHGHINTSIRTIEYDPAVDAAHPPDLGTTPSYPASSTLRDGGMAIEWLVNPNGYTILTACGPHERAEELSLAEGKKNGALSYFLVCTLNILVRDGIEVTHRSLYHHLCGRFRTHWPTQNPMRYGREDFTFFGALRSGTEMAFIPVFMEKGRLCLRAGRAHGISVGDEYAIYSISSVDGVTNGVGHAPIAVRVSDVRGLSSDLVGTDLAYDAWKARPLRRRSSRNANIRLNRVDNRSQWVAAAEQKPFLYFSIQDTEGQECDFSVTRNDRDEYEILDKLGQKITGLPTIPVGREGASDYILSLLEHLATFRHVQAVENLDRATLFDKCNIQPSKAPSTVSDKAVYELDHRDSINFTVQNTSDGPLYLYVYDLGPLWQINGLIGRDGGGDYMVVPPGEKKVCLRMTVPESFISRGEHQCEDIVKIFITNQPTSFAILELPEISVSSLGLAEEYVRGDCRKRSKSRSWMSALLRGEHGFPEERWAVHDFVIRTCYAPDKLNTSG